MTRVVGEYVLGRQLGAGGMATVFQATHRATGALRALKLVDLRGPNQLEDMERFDREARTLAKVDRHPHVVRVHAHGRTPPGFGYCVLEWVDGEDLAGRLRRGPLPLEELLGILGPVTEALAHCHAEGIVHRDLKPANVLIRRDGHAFLTDFGVARDAVEARITQTQGLVGTPHYMSPEQCRGDGSPVGPAADVFALGLVLYEAAVGRLPFAGESALALMSARACGEGVRLDLRGLPEDLGLLIERCVAVDPEERPSARVCGEALRAIGGGEASPLGVRRGRWWVGAAAVAIGVGVGWAVWPTEPREVGVEVVLREEGGWVELALLGRDQDPGRLRVAVGGEDPERALETAWDRLRAGEGDPDLWTRVALRLAVASGASWPEDVEPGGTPETQALVACCRGVGWLGGSVDVDAVLRELPRLPEGALREALEALDAETQEVLETLREAVARRDTGWTRTTPGGVPVALAEFGEALGRRRWEEGLRAGVRALSARCRRSPPTWESRSLALELAAVMARVVSQSEDVEALRPWVTELGEVLATSAWEAIRDERARARGDALARVAITSLDGWGWVPDWESGSARAKLTEVFHVGFLQGADEALLDVVRARLYVRVCGWLKPDDLQHALTAEALDELRALTASCEDPWRLFMAAVVATHDGSRRPVPARVELLARALGEALTPAERVRLGVSPIAPLEGRLTLYWALHARRELCLRLVRGDGSPEERKAAVELLLATVASAEERFPPAILFEHVSEVAQRLFLLLQEEPDAWWRAEAGAMCRAQLESVARVLAGLSAEERGYAEFLALALGVCSRNELQSSVFKLSNLLLTCQANEPERLEAFARDYLRRSEGLGLGAQPRLRLWLVSQYARKGEHERVLEASQALVGEATPPTDMSHSHDQAKWGARLRRVRAFLSLGRREEAEVELAQYEREVAGTTFAHPPSYERLVEALRRQEGGP